MEGDGEENDSANTASGDGEKKILYWVAPMDSNYKMIQHQTTATKYTHSQHRHELSNTKRQ